MINARTGFGLASGPDQNASGSAQGVNGDPRVYAVGGTGPGGALSACEKYDPNTDTWMPIAPLPVALPDCSAAFVPNYAPAAVNLGYIYVAGGGVASIFQYDIKNDSWTTLPLPFAPVAVSLQYLDDIGGPLANIFVAATGVDLPPCTDSQILWAVGGQGTEKVTWFVESNESGELVGAWARGPDLPLLRMNPSIGRVFWRDAGITTFGVSNCATIAVCGGNNGTSATTDVQLLVRNADCNWSWIHRGANPTGIPNDVLTLATAVEQGAFGTEQWPETLVTGGRALVVGGVPSIANEGSVQFAQLRFYDGRLQRDQCLAPQRNNAATAWNTTTQMPGPRVALRAAPLTQENSSFFGGRRVSRFLCAGGRDASTNDILDRVQLFQLPVPSAFAILRQDEQRCTGGTQVNSACQPLFKVPRAHHRFT